MLLTPLALNFAPSEMNLLLENKPLFEAFGFDIELFGTNTISVRQIPVWLDAYDTQTVLGEAAEMLALGKQVELREGVAHTIACKAAIKAGRDSAAEEIADIVDSVLGQNDLKYCPHGRPIIAFVSKVSLEKQVRRKV